MARDHRASAALRYEGLRRRALLLCANRLCMWAKLNVTTNDNHSVKLPSAAWSIGCQVQAAKRAGYTRDRVAPIRKLLACPSKLRVCFPAMRTPCNASHPLPRRRGWVSATFDNQRSIRAAVKMQKRYDPVGWMPDRDRELVDVSQFSEEQLRAIQVDTRLPGEIGYTYGVSAAVILYIKRYLARSGG